jgi:hypothetical protein
MSREAVQNKDGMWSVSEDVFERAFYKKHIAEMTVQKEIQDHVWIFDWSRTRKIKKNVSWTKNISMFRRNKDWAAMFTTLR